MRGEEEGEEEGGGGEGKRVRGEEEGGGRKRVRKGEEEEGGGGRGLLLYLALAFCIILLKCEQKMEPLQ